MEVFFFFIKVFPIIPTTLGISAGEGDVAILPTLPFLASEILPVDLST